MPLALAQAVAEGLTLAEFYGGSYKTTDPPPAPPPAWTVVVSTATRRRCGRCQPRWRAAAFSASAATWRASWPTSRATR